MNRKIFSRLILNNYKVSLVWIIVILTLLAIPASAMAVVKGVYWTDRDNATVNYNNLSGTNTVLASTPFRAQDVILDAATNTLYFSDFGASGSPGIIDSMKTNGSGRTNVYAGARAIHQLALDAATGSIYFARGVTPAGWEVSRVNTNGTGYTVFASGAAGANGSHFPSGIALDLSGSQLYFGDIGILASLGSVNIMSLPGAAVTQQTAHVTGQGRNFAFDPSVGTIFLTSHNPLTPGSGGGVFTFSVGGSSVSHIASNTNTGNWGIQVDPDDQRVYFTDYSAGQILSTRYDGSDLQVLVSGLTNPYGLALDLVEASTIPTMSAVGLILLILLISGVVVVTVRKQ